MKLFRILPVIMGSALFCSSLCQAQWTEVGNMSQIIPPLDLQNCQHRLRVTNSYSNSAYTTNTNQYLPLTLGSDSIRSTNDYRSQYFDVLTSRESLSPLLSKSVGNVDDFTNAFRRGAVEEHYVSVEIKQTPEDPNGGPLRKNFSVVVVAHLKEVGRSVTVWPDSPDIAIEKLCVTTPQRPITRRIERARRARR